MEATGGIEAGLTGSRRHHMNGPNCLKRPWVANGPVDPLLGTIAGLGSLYL